MNGRRADRAGKVLIGRSPERAALDQLLERLRGGGSGVVLLAGEAGIGKTHLIETLLQAGAVTTLRGPSRDHRAATSFAPVTALLRAYLAASPGAFQDAAVRGALAPLLPELGPPPHTDAGSLDGLHRALRSAVQAMAGAGPLALVFEDAQWADHATLEWLPVLAEELPPQTALLISFRPEGLARDHPLRRARQALRRVADCEEISLRPLDAAESAQLAAATLGTPPSAEVAALLHDRSEGVPLFVEELAVSLQAAGQPGAAPDLRLDVPLTLRDAVLTGLDALPAGVRAAAESASVIGLDFDADLLLDLLPDESAFDALIEHGLLTLTGSRASFRHALIRDAIYGSVPWGRRRRLHRQVAEQLERLAAPPGVSAQHWLAGREPERARTALLAAVGASCRLHAYRDAASAARRALELWPAGQDGAGRLELLHQLGRCAQNCGLLDEASRSWREAAEAHRAAGDRRGQAESLRRLALSLELQGRWPEALDARQQAAAAFAGEGLPGPAAEERLSIGSTLRASGHPSAALEVLAAGLQDARRAERHDLEARLLGNLGNALVRSGQADAGLARAQEGLTLALAGHFTDATVDVLHRIADALEHVGDYAASRDLYVQALGLCDSDATSAAFACRACVTVPLYQTGAWDQTVSECRSLLKSGAPPMPRALAGALLGTVLAHRGQPARARPLLIDALSLGRQFGHAPVQLRTLWGLALAQAAEGQPAAAVGEVRQLLDLWDTVEDHYHVLLPVRWAARLLAGQGADADLRRASDALGHAAEKNGGPVAFSALAHTLGELAQREGQPERALQQFTVALELLRDVNTPFEQAFTQLRTGELLTRLGEREAALGHLTSAQRTARQLGAGSLLRDVSRALTRLGAEPAAQDSGLTPRQLEVLQLVARGWTDKAVARSLRLSPRTVEMHVGHILASLDSRSRAEAVGRAAELGLLEQVRPHSGT